MALSLINCSTRRSSKYKFKNSQARFLSSISSTDHTFRMSGVSLNEATNRKMPYGWEKNKKQK